ncbi:MAG: Gfo/Idh/MocA family oxidoreductase [Chloroflexota bacterium]|nr:Gfo/Idh/MocA family oxidoreductase [Chloroflexota bacterium]
MKVIQVGIGGMGDFWLNIVNRSPEVEYAAYVETNADIAQQQIAKYNLDPALIFPTLEDALATVKAAAVINVTPPQFHKPISIIALDAKLPVLCEKPLSGTRADAEALAEYAERSGVLLMVAQNYRYSAVAQTVKKMLTAGELGALTAVSVNFYKAPRSVGFRDSMPQPLIIDMAIHHFDMLRYFLDSNPVEIFARTWNPAWSWFKGDASATVWAAFANGVKMNYTGSWVTQGQETPWNAHWRFEGERGVMTVEYDTISLQRANGVEDDGGSYHQIYGDKLQIPLVTMDRQAQDYLLYEFYQAVTTGTSPATTAQDNLNTLHFVFDAVESAESGQVIKR